MTAAIDSFDVFSAEFGAKRRIDLVEYPGKSHLDFIADKWRPKLEPQRDRATIAFRALAQPKQTEDSWHKLQGQYGAPDSHWDWNEIVKEMGGSTHRLYALVDEASVEAMMRLDLSKPSRLKISSYDPTVYIDYLAVAPWNRKQIQSPPRFNGFGTIMLGVAVSVSMAEGFHGRCGLHSLPQSEGFYSKAGMTLIPHEAKDGMRILGSWCEAGHFLPKPKDTISTTNWRPKSLLSKNFTEKITQMAMGTLLAARIGLAPLEALALGLPLA